jgi:hypothetical protein
MPNVSVLFLELILGEQEYQAEVKYKTSFFFVGY